MDSKRGTGNQPVRAKKKAPTFRGIDFLMRYTQGQWSEKRLEESLALSDEYRAVPYGRSTVGPTDQTEIEAYYDQYRQIESVGKRPDLLVLRRSDHKRLAKYVKSLKDTTLATDEAMAPVLKLAVCGLEAENSLWRAAKMPDYSPSGSRRITRMSFVAPTVIVKEEDEANLLAWQEHHGIKVAIVQVFYDLAFIVPLDQIAERVRQIRRVEAEVRAEFDSDGAVRRASGAEQKALGTFIRVQPFHDARSGAVTRKTLYSTHYSAATLFGHLDPDDPPKPTPGVLEDARNGKIIPYVAFEGGRLNITQEAIAVLRELGRNREPRRNRTRKVRKRDGPMTSGQ